MYWSVNSYILINNNLLKLLLLYILIKSVIIGVEHVAGDMLVEIPKGDAIIMKVSIYAYKLSWSN